MVIAGLQASDTGQFAKFGQLIYRFQCSILKLYAGICNLLKLFIAISILPIKILPEELIDNYYKYTYTKKIMINNISNLCIGFINNYYEHIYLLKSLTHNEKKKFFQHGEEVKHWLIIIN